MCSPAAMRTNPPADGAACRGRIATDAGRSTAAATGPAATATRAAATGTGTRAATNARTLSTLPPSLRRPRRGPVLLLLLEHDRVRRTTDLDHAQRTLVERAEDRVVDQYQLARHLGAELDDRRAARR